MFHGVFLIVALYALHTTHKPILSAAGYTILISVVVLLTGTPFKEVLSFTVISIIYMTSFFLLLERVSSNLVTWWLILLVGVILWLWIIYIL